ncbi:MAG: DedA family protein [Frankiales bacterium]|nr:DedA family protein [Frankiales bacterium]
MPGPAVGQDVVVPDLTSLPGPAVYAVVAVLVYAEAALLVGVVLPAETAVIVGGVLAHRGTVSLSVLLPLVVVMAIAGDSTGWLIGHRYGDAVLGSRLLRRHQSRLDGARDFLRRRGATAVFLGRFVAFLRATVPTLAGLSHLPFRRFAPANAAGGLLWGIGFTLLGFYASASYQRLQVAIGRVSLLVVSVLALAAVAVVLVRRRRAQPG